MTINKAQKSQHLILAILISSTFASQQTVANTKYHNEHNRNKAFEISGYEIKIA